MWGLDKPALKVYRTMNGYVLEWDDEGCEGEPFTRSACVAADESYPAKGDEGAQMELRLFEHISEILELGGHLNESGYVHMEVRRKDDD